MLRSRYIVHRINQLTAQKVKRRSVVKHEVVERIGEYFCHPYQAGADIANEKQLHGTEQQAAKADAQPDLTNVLD